ncbi:hypothetical protein BLOT_007101 [Blomia tropicalis]|nr:hypothetical protein BLOT_007101 [Blomia tropicalis]
MVKTKPVSDKVKSRKSNGKKKSINGKSNKKSKGLKEENSTRSKQSAKINKSSSKKSSTTSKTHKSTLSKNSSSGKNKSKSEKNKKTNKTPRSIKESSKSLKKNEKKVEPDDKPIDEQPPAKIKSNDDPRDKSNKKSGAENTKTNETSLKKKKAKENDDLDSDGKKKEKGNTTGAKILEKEKNEKDDDKNDQKENKRNSSQLSEEGFELVKPKETTQQSEIVLEFTKPTINQVTKEKKEVPISYADTIECHEFEGLFDELNDLMQSVQTLRSSYGSILKSLVNQMNSRREKKKARKKDTSDKAKDINFMTTKSELNAGETKKLENESANLDRYDMERFTNPVSRDDAFNTLFTECDDLTRRTEVFRTEFFDERTNFLVEKYDAQNKADKMDRKRFNHYKLWCKRLRKVLDEIIRCYNDDMLNMFRVHD